MSAQQNQQQVGIVSLDPAFDRLIGKNAAMRKVIHEENGQQTFHEAGIYLPKHNRVYLSSNRLPDSKFGQRSLLISVPLDKIPSANTQEKSSNGILPDLSSDEQNKLYSTLEILEQLPEHMAMLNGATNWDDDSVLWCEQGNDNRKLESNFVLHNVVTNETTSLLNNFEGKPFSSLNDAVRHPTTRSVFFTDPDYGVEQSFKSPEKDYAPNGVYSWNPKTNKVKLIDASNYSKPNGVTFLPAPANDGSGLLITTDTGIFRFRHKTLMEMGDFYLDQNAPSVIYSYKVLPDSESKDGFPAVDVGSRKLFAKSTSGAPDGIHVDQQGNVWAGHGDGVHCYQVQSDASGKLIGKFILPGGRGCANFCWAGKTNLGQYRQLLFAEDQLWETLLDVNGQD
ncbi:hypothetical protein NDA14_004840 [Ustilago hordei]|nr:hypothetical protein NDA10_001610 [Ustilago hordei]KAJ1597578.1 hypothetical protein NDA14_004840 [Ustilago hordei]UTT88548.1 hypothetical protein NDA17_005329 [Ustilago hordei]